MTKQIQAAHSVCADFSYTPRLIRTTIILVAFVLVPVIIVAQAASAQTRAISQVVGATEHGVGLGNVLTSADGGQIFGFDINENEGGTDGILTEAVTAQDGSVTSAVETFDLTTGQITKTVTTLVAPKGADELVMFGIGGNDVGLVDYEREHVKNDQLMRDDIFGVLNPVSGEKSTGPWTPPHPENSVLQDVAQNQSTSTQVVMVFRLTENQPEAWLYVTDLATNTFLNSIYLKRGGSFVIAQDTATNQAVLPTSDGAGTPIIEMVNLTTAKITWFLGFNNGFDGAGMQNGLAVDSNTDIACTTTQLNSQVEFYTLATGAGTYAQLPDTTDTSELTAGWAVTNDPVNGLFLVAQPYSSTEPNGSTIYVYNETADLIETIQGFNFPNSNLPLTAPVRIAINPSLRVGWVNGPNVNQLQQFFY